ncbi:CENP-b protein 1 [Phytophthora cinnamomi]|uniref:CENP-b protein 1 n=1 Tax=Phytophthora cinnamomi TaxID=4785 RepID=UPI00355A9841|nr:CENP-b protein 1 [Phytophthora cinnamomi]
MPRRTHLSVAQKAELRLYHRAHPDLTHEDIIRWAQLRFSVLLGRSTVGSILRAPQDSSLNPDAKRNQEGRFPQMERDLYQFVLNSPDLGDLSDLVLCTKANELLQGRQSVTKSWVFRFKQRHAFGALKNLRRLIDDYEPRDVFNLDETGLFYQMPPRKLQVAETKRPKHLSIGLCCNMDGSEKLEPVVIHSEQNGVEGTQIPVRLYANAQAWMTGDNFTDWLHAFNALMKDRHVLLLVDNAPCHGTTEIELSNVRVHFLPPSTPAHLQPMRAGIIQQFKVHVKALGVQWMLDHRRSGGNLGDTEAKMGLLTAVKHIVQSWQHVATHFISNCWAHTGIVSGDTLALLPQHNVPKIPLDTTMLDRIIALVDPSEPMTGVEYINAEKNVPEWMPLSEELPPAPRSRRATHPQHECDGMVEKDDDRTEVKSLSHGDALAAAIQLSAYAFANGIDAPDLQRVIEFARVRCRGSGNT